MKVLKSELKKNTMKKENPTNHFAVQCSGYTDETVLPIDGEDVLWVSVNDHVGELSVGRAIGV